MLGVDDVESQRFEAIPRDELVDRAQHTAQAAADRLARTGCSPRQLVRSGPAERVAMEVADEIDAELIVVGAGKPRDR